MATPSAPGMPGYDVPVPRSSSLSSSAQPSLQDKSHPLSPRANKGERRRSLPRACPTAEASPHRPRRDRPEEQEVPRSLYERRRNASAVSHALTVNTVSSASSGSPTAPTGRSTASQSLSQSDRSQRSATSDSFAVSRLRSNSGLSLHTNSAALRRYTDYNADGSSRLSPTRETRGGTTTTTTTADASLSLDGRTLDDGASGLFAWDTVRAVLDHPVARARLWAYTRATGGAENLAFLEKVDAYARALHGVTALMATISTTFTCVTATDPLRLPPHLAKALNTDVKHVSSSILPGLEMLFGDVDAHIRDRVLRHIYPAFAKHQLRLRMKAALGAPSSASAGAPASTAADTPFAFAGLGRAFCLTDPYRPDSPIVYASDGFAHLLGYDRAEDIARTGRFFRGPEPGRSAKNEEQFAEDLVLSRNHRDNRPFWSLVSVCPLKNASGRVRFVLSGLVDVTDAVKSQHDIVHALSAEPPAAAPGPPDAAPPRMGDRRMSTLSTHDLPSPPVPAAAERVSRSKSVFFNPFSRRRKASVAVADDAECVRAALRAATNTAAPTALAAIASTGDDVAPRPASPVPPTDLLATYARFMVLQYVAGTSPSSPTSSPSSTATVSRLKVAFSSIPMLELLGLGPAAQDAVMYHDVFAVLSELAGSPSITPVFRAHVRQRIVTSESASLELCVPAASCGVPGLTGAPGALSAGLGAGLASPSTALGAGDDAGSAPPSTARRASLRLGGRRMSRQEDDDASMPSGWTGRRRRSIERPPSAATKAREPKMQRLMSHWTPLKDADGAVAWVILVVSPVVE